MPPHFEWNFAFFLVDFVCFGVAFTFVSVNSVMPALVGQLTDSAPLIGLISTVFTGCWLLPQLLAARLISDKPRKKPYIVFGISGRVLLLVIAIALWGGLAQNPAAMLTLFFVCLGSFAVLDGIASVAWFDVMARAIPAHRRGRLVGVGQVISGLIGAGVGLVVGAILERYPFPNNHAMLFALAGAALVPSTLAILLIREPPPEPAAAPVAGQGRPKSDWLYPLLHDRAFLRLTLCRLLVGMMGLASSFYVVHAESELHLPERTIGSFVVAQTLTGVVASALLGVLSEHRGARAVARVGSAAAVAGPLFALFTHVTQASGLIRAYPFVYATLGIVNSTWMLGFFNYLLEIAPEEMRPTYVGLGNTISGALTFIPMLGGWLLETTSYTVLFAATTAIVAVGFLFSLGLKAPQSSARRP